MASPAPTTRRALFAIGGGLAAAAAIPAAQALGQIDEWDRKIAALQALHPDLGRSAREAQAAGYQTHELMLVFMGNERERPFLQFQRRFNEEFHPATFDQKASA